MNIQTSTIEDTSEIFRLYGLATHFQKLKWPQNQWPKFDIKMVQMEIEENHQFKLIEDGKIACVWAIALADPLIWKERDVDTAIYIHRIATNPDFRGRKLVQCIVDWALLYSKENGIDYVRMDTVGDNKGLISYYQKCGFEFLGFDTLSHTEGLPAHYRNATVSLFEIEVAK